jgi:hypothetical protein
VFTIGKTKHAYRTLVVEHDGNELHGEMRYSWR